MGQKNLKNIELFYNKTLVLLKKNIVSLYKKNYVNSSYIALDKKCLLYLLDFFSCFHDSLQTSGKIKKQLLFVKNTNNWTMNALKKFLIKKKNLMKSV